MIAVGRHIGGPTDTRAVWISVDGHAFPGAMWTDNALVILGWWAQGLTSLTQRQAPRAELLFMEGPYEVWVSESDLADNWKLETVERRATGHMVVGEYLVPAAGFAKSLLVAAKEVLGDLPPKPVGTDVHDLAAATRALSLAVASRWQEGGAGL